MSNESAAEFQAVFFNGGAIFLTAVFIVEISVNASA